MITTAEDEYCDIYDSDVLGVVQNDSRYTHIQTYLAHRLLTASATIDDNAVTMTADGDSDNAFAPFTVVNTRGFDLPQTGSNGNWIYPVIGLLFMAASGTAVIFVVKRRQKDESAGAEG